MKYLIVFCLLLTGCTVKRDLEGTQKKVNKMLLDVNRKEACLAGVNEVRIQLFLDDAKDLSPRVRQNMVAFCMAQEAPEQQ